MTRTKTILLTRPKAQSLELANSLKATLPDAVKCLISPLMDIQPTGALPDVSSFQALLFTSMNGVETFIKMGGQTDLTCFCVGDRTAIAARALGLKARSAAGNVQSLISLICDTSDPNHGALLHIRGEHTTGDVIAKLTARGFAIREAVLYRQNPVPLTPQARAAFLSGEIDALPLFSPRTARLLAAELHENPTWPRAHITALCLSENITQELPELGAVKIAKTPSRDEMHRLIVQFCTKSG
ncbi:MAG: uroporphyrinogen-III synthase [Paracoccaceae bacterium]